jgi:hypothetical protein
MAYLPPFLFNSAPTSGDRHQSAEGFVAAFISAIDPGYLDTSGHAGQERGSKRRGTTFSAGRISATSFTYDKEFIYKRLAAIIHAFAGGVAPFCTYEGIRMK